MPIKKVQNRCVFLSIETYLYVDGRDVDVQVNLLAEALPAQSTRKVPLLPVHQLDVLVQHGLVGTHVVAVGTLEGLLRAVHVLHVRLQVDLLTKGGATLRRQNHAYIIRHED